MFVSHYSVSMHDIIQFVLRCQSVLFAKFCFKSFKRAQTTWNIKQVSGDGSVSESIVKGRFNKFREGDFCLEGNERRTPLLDEDVIRAFAEENLRTAARDFAEYLSVSKLTVSDHLKAIGKM